MKTFYICGVEQYRCGKMENEFENALQALLNFEYTGAESAEKYNELFRTMVTASMKICGETDYNALVNQKIEAAEKKYGLKMEASGETDPYKKLRELVRFEMARDALLAGREYEVCCTESNFAMAVLKFRSDIEKLVPESQKEALDSMAYSLYSDFTNFFVCASFDMVADAKIYEMKEFRPLQINAMGKEIRTSVNVMAKQNGKPQKSETVTKWFHTMMVLPAFLFKKLYAVSMVEMMAVPQKLADDAAHMFKGFDAILANFAAADEYKVLQNFLKELQLENCFTVRPKTQKGDPKIVVN